MDFNEIYSSYRGKIHRYVKRMVGEFEAEDLTQDVFIKVQRGLNDFRGESMLSTWIYRIATNTAMDRLRGKSFQAENMKKVSIDSPGACNKSDEETASAGQKLVKEEMSGCVRRFIDKLSSSYRSVVVLSELEGLKNQEIADILGISLHTVKIRLHRARLRLKQELEKGCTFYRNRENILECDLKESFEEFKKNN
jgi:RNA polymerase sigma-70 factor (ECF subfamily)